MKESADLANAYAERNNKNNISSIFWTLAWVGTLIAADKAVLYGWYSSDWVSILAIVFNASLGLGVILAFMRMLRGMDDLQRNIQLNSLAFAVGVGFVGGFTLLLLATTKLISEADISDILVLMSIAYMGMVVYGQVKYR